MSWINKHIKDLDKRIAIVDVNGEFSYAQLSQQSRSYSQYIEQKIEEGHVVAILSDYNIYAIALFLALLEKKCIIIPISTRNQEEIDKRLQVVNCDWVVRIDKNKLQMHQQTHADKHALLNDLVESNQAGLILFSSGSTGEPKAMIHNLDNLVNSFKGKKLKSLNMLVFLMFDHVGGINTLLNTLSMGARIIFPNNRNPDYIAGLVEKYKIHVLPASPTFLNMMLITKVDEKYDLTCLKMITYGTEPMPESLLKKLKAAFPKARLLQTFGTSETGIAKTASRSSGSLDMKFDDPSLEYKVVNGELWLKSKTQVMGYLNSAMDSFTDDGWFQTGDLVEELGDGYLRVIGRNKEVINVGGEKVLPTEVESVILELDEVDDCMVYGEKNSITGHMVAVQIVLKPGVEQIVAKKLIRAYCKVTLESYKAPIKFNFMDKTSFGERFKKIRISK